MSIARHHAEWLSLVPVSGPFLSLPVLMEAFNTGLEPHDPDQSRLLRQEYANWQESFENRKGDPAPHQHWIKFVLTRTLELDERVLVEGQAISQTLQAEVQEHHELLRPSIVVSDPNTKKPRLLVQTYPRSQELTSYAVNSRWKASPDTRMTELLHATGVRLGLVTNGEHWMLVDAPKGETTGYASWYAALWLEEPITLRAFRSLLSASRFFNVPDDQTLETLLTKSASNQQEVTDQLGYQVRRAVEVLIHSLDRADQDFGRELLAEVSPAQLYESALTVMMRLVFLFCAEERELIPSKPFPVYEQNYSVSTISRQLRDLADQHGEELLERRYDAWPRLLAAFRAVYGGLRHDDVHIPAYGGNLFNPDRFPFLEGRKLGTSWLDTEANPLPVNNRTALHLLEALQYLEMKVSGIKEKTLRRISFKHLDIEQIGHVYEGLLDHTAKRATEPFLGLAGTRDKEPEIPLAKLEELLAKGEAELLKYLKDETGKSESALKKSLKIEFDSQEAARFRTACQDAELWKRVEPLGGLVRLDSFGYPVIVTTGSVFVTSGTDRRSSGTHYTPKTLTEPIVQYTLEPLVYVGPAEGLPKDQWKLKSAKELLELKICDMACGSGAFLVQACRYMAIRLLEAWGNTPTAITPYGEPATGAVSEQIVPTDADERMTYALRIVAQRCLYGVDKNPLAAEMAKLSLWLLTMAKEKPFEFLDHAIRCGDSLVGLHKIEQLRHLSLDGKAEVAAVYVKKLDAAISRVIELRQQLAAVAVRDVTDVEHQAQLHAEATALTTNLRAAADLLIADAFQAKRSQEGMLSVVGKYVAGRETELPALAAKVMNFAPFHWPLEFPEVIIERGGFDAFVGNPPFLGGKRISTTHGDSFERYLKLAFSQSKGAADLCCYFFRRGFNLLRPHVGCLGLLATNSLVEGDSRAVGIGAIVGEGGRLYNARREFPWPGQAGVYASQVNLSRSHNSIACVLNGSPVASISVFLDEAQALEPYRLASGTISYTQGQTLNGEGFMLDEAQATRLIEMNIANKYVVKPYLNAELFNGNLPHVPHRWVIDFGVMEQGIASRYTEPFAIVTEKVKPHRDTLTRQVHESRYWLYWDKREKFIASIRAKNRVLVLPIVTKHLSFMFFPPTWVFSHRLKVFDVQDMAVFSVLQSSVHEAWARQFSSTLEQRLNYSTSDAFDTFPFPSTTDAIQCTGSAYYQYRESLLTKAQHGLTDCYNRFHHPEKFDADIQKLRQLHVEMDNAVATAYGWTDLDLGHGFHETKQGVRYTISEPARREVLQRLLKLNHERYAEEVKQGLHDKKKGKTKAGKTKGKKTGDDGLFG